MKPEIADAIIRYAYDLGYGDLEEREFSVVQSPEEGMLRINLSYPVGSKMTYPGSWEQPPEYQLYGRRDTYDFVPDYKYGWVDKAIDWLHDKYIPDEDIDDADADIVRLDF